MILFYNRLYKLLLLFLFIIQTVQMYQHQRKYPKSSKSMPASSKKYNSPVSNAVPKTPKRSKVINVVNYPELLKETEEEELLTISTDHRRRSALTLDEKMSLVRTWLVKNSKFFHMKPATDEDLQTRYSRPGAAVLLLPKASTQLLLAKVIKKPYNLGIKQLWNEKEYLEHCIRIVDDLQDGIQQLKKKMDKIIKKLHDDDNWQDEVETKKIPIPHLDLNTKVQAGVKSEEEKRKLELQELLAEIRKNPKKFDKMFD